MLRRGDADLVIEGRIATFSAGPGFGWVDALAIHAGRVIAAGTQAQVGSLVGPATRHWRLGSHLFVMPSLCDAHLHLQAAALAVAQPDLTGLDRDAASELIAARHEERITRGDVDGWLLGHGWSLDALGARPEASWLDEAAPGRPVALWAHDHHARWVSARAVQLAELAARPDPEAGHIERDDEGRPTGILYEAAAGLIDEAIPAPTADEVDAAVGAYALTLAQFGVTAVHDPGGLIPDPGMKLGVGLYHDMARAGRLPLRVTASIREEQLDAAIALGFRSGSEGPWLDAAATPSADTGRYQDGWLKLFSDGALGSRTAALLAPYDPGDPVGPPPERASGMRLRTPDHLTALVRRAAEAGIASQIHAIGDAAVRTALEVLATAPTVGSIRHRVEHAQLVHVDDVGRFAALGVAASVQPCHLLSDAASMDVAWGSRTASAFPLRALDAAGTLLPFGTDAPVEPADPWPGIAAAVTRRGARWTPGTAFHPEQAIDLPRALRAACLDGPRSAGRTDQGHLGAGARADLLVLPAEPIMGMPDAASIAAQRPVATLLDGVVVYPAAGFEA